mgnify:CR=1 FL=1
MEPRFLKLLENCITTGLEVGYNRAHKHIDEPSEFDLCECQFEAIMSEIHDSFTFDELEVLENSDDKDDDSDDDGLGNW